MITGFHALPFDDIQGCEFLFWLFLNYSFDSPEDFELVSSFLDGTISITASKKFFVALTILSASFLVSRFLLSPDTS